MNLEEIDFRNIDFHRTGEWPLSARLAAVVIASVVAMILSYLLFMHGALNQLSQVNQEYLQLKKDYKEKYAIANTVEESKGRNLALQQLFKEKMQFLPQDPMVAEFIDSLSQAIINNHLIYKEIKPGDPIYTDGSVLVALPISLKLQGTYHELVSFLASTTYMKRVFTIEEISIISKKTDNDTDENLEIVLDARTYWLNTNNMDKVKMKSAKGTKKGSKK